MTSTDWRLSTKHWQQIRPKVLARDGYRCRLRYDEVCLSPRGHPLPTAKLQVDHIVPRSAGGSDSLSNLRAVCGPCNNYRQAVRATASRKW